MKCSQIKCPLQRDITKECDLYDCPYRTEESPEPQEIVKEIAHGIVAQIQESEDEFIYTMISPFCEMVVEKNLSKKELERILRRGMQSDWIPVSEKPLDDETPVLVTISIPGQKPVVRNGVYNNGYFFIDNGDAWAVTDREVTAWMPSPEPYIPGREEKK